MPQFRYQALNADKNPVAGEILADSVAQAIAQVEAAGLSVQSIGYATGERPNVPLVPTKSDSPALSAADQAALEARLIRIVERGRALIPALVAYAEEIPRSASRRQLLDVIRILQSGEIPQAAAALRRRADYWIPLIASATNSHGDNQLLQAILREFPQSTPFSPRGRAWLLYPMIVVCFALAVFLLLGAFVVPVYRDIFAGFGLPLPGVTRLVLAFYATITNGVFIAMIALIGIVALIANRISARVNRKSGSGLARRPPTRSLAIAQFASHLADLLDADFAAAASMRLASSAIQRPQLKRAACRIAEAMNSPATVSATADRRTITSSILFALQTEMPARARSAVLREISRCHENRAAAVFSWTHGAFEPLAILVVGFLVAMTVIGFYLPLFTLLQTLS
jgi:type IV pilus assembly protein PilC